jgi:hypothetical protein
LKRFGSGRSGGSAETCGVGRSFGLGLGPAMVKEPEASIEGEREEQETTMRPRTIATPVCPRSR